MPRSNQLSYSPWGNAICLCRADGIGYPYLRFHIAAYYQSRAYDARAWLLHYCPVPGKGFEPSHPCGPGGLSPLRLPVPPPGLGLRFDCDSFGSQQLWLAGFSTWYKVSFSIIAYFTLFCKFPLEEFSLTGQEKPP